MCWHVHINMYATYTCHPFAFYLIFFSFFVNLFDSTLSIVVHLNKKLAADQSVALISIFNQRISLPTHSPYVSPHLHKKLLKDFFYFFIFIFCLLVCLSQVKF